ncbi:8109_t:CDS:2, partial [Racocetra persica]
DCTVGDRISNTDLNKFIRSYEVNIFTALYWTQTALPHLNKVNGKIINISSAASIFPMVGSSAYCSSNVYKTVSSSKAALNMITSCLAEEEKEIQTIAICPGPVYTETMEANYKKIEHLNKYSKEELREKTFHPEDTGHYVWRLITNFPTEFNGKFVPSTEPSLASYHKRTILSL